MAALMARENTTNEDLFDARPSKRIDNVQVEADGDTSQETNRLESFSEPGMAAMLAQENNSTSEDLFEARPSNRIGDVQVEADGDTWQEVLAVCEAPPTADAYARKLVIRSYYQNKHNRQRVWDEPPSGASKILPASDEMREMAYVQLSELHVVTTPRGVVTPTKKKRGLFGFGKKKDKSPKEDKKIQYRPGSGSKMFAKTRAYTADDEELATAKAISLSQAEEHGETEEQILVRVMEESKQEAAAGAKRGGGRPRTKSALAGTLSRRPVRPSIS
jgi:hypothetical protein